MSDQTKIQIFYQGPMPLALLLKRSSGKVWVNFIITIKNDRVLPLTFIEPNLRIPEILIDVGYS